MDRCALRLCPGKLFQSVERPGPWDKIGLRTIFSLLRLSDSTLHTLSRILLVEASTCDGTDAYSRFDNFSWPSRRLGSATAHNGTGNTTSDSNNGKEEKPEFRSFTKVMGDLPVELICNHKMDAAIGGRKEQKE